MTLTRILPLIVAVLYLTTGIAHLRKGEVAAFGLWLSYAVGNVFIIMMANK
jgi:hypothetical protein